MQALQHKSNIPLDEIDTQTAARLLNCDPSTIKRKIASGDLYASIIRGYEGRGGISYRIPIDSLPPDAQMRWRAMQAGTVAEVDLTTYKERKAQAAVDKLQLSRRAKAEEKRIREEAGRAVMAELQAKVDAMEELALLAGRRGGVMETKQAIADRLGIGLRQLYAYQKAYEEEGIEGLMDKAKRTVLCVIMSTLEVTESQALFLRFRHSLLRLVTLSSPYFRKHLQIISPVAVSMD